jgi:hypothetical protein
MVGVFEQGLGAYIMDWATGADPDSQDFQDKTQGTNYIKIDKIIQIDGAVTTKKEVDDKPGAFATVLAKGFYSDELQVKGHILDTGVGTVVGRLGDWKDWMYSERDDTTLYCALCLGSDVYIPFTNGGTYVQMSEGTTVGVDFRYKYVIVDKQFVLEIIFTWKSKASW